MIEDIENGFRLIHKAMQDGKFTERDLRYIKQFCEIVLASTSKLLDKIDREKLQNRS
jgi:hypothetical protein